jgi:hypothetical protein
MKSVVHGLPRDAERVPNIRRRRSKLTRLDDARRLELLEVPPEPVDRLECLERELGRLRGA